MRRLLLPAMAAWMAFVLSGCFALQGFSLTSGAIAAGGKTKAGFILRPFEGAENKNFQFVVVGVPTGGDLAIGKATWGVDGKYGGPIRMPISTPLPTALTASGQCSANGLAFENITGTKWKGFMTSTKVNDRGNVLVSTEAQVTVRARASAVTYANYKVFGLTGVWIDDGDGVVESGDTFYCTGVASTALYVFPLI